jgi:hypothetical protein
MGLFRPRPWLIPLFVGLAIAVFSVLAAGFKARTELLRL